MAFYCRRNPPSALIHIQQVVSLAEAFSKSAPFLVPSLPSSTSSLFAPPHTPFSAFSTFSTPMPSPYPLMSPSPLPSPASFLHEQASIPADIAKQIKQEREKDREREREQTEAARKRLEKGKDKDGAPFTPPSAAGGKRKLDESEAEEEDTTKADSESKRAKHANSQPRYSQRISTQLASLMFPQQLRR